MKIGDTDIRDTFAEAFEMRFARLLVTAHDQYWLDRAIREVIGYGSSVIGCDAEVGREAWVSEDETPDGRPGASLLFFGRSTDSLQEAIVNRIGQSVMTCPTSAIFDWLSTGDKKLSLGRHLRFFGDGFQKSKMIGDQRFWRIPVMDGEFLVADRVQCAKGVAGGNLLLEAETIEKGLEAARVAADVVTQAPRVMSPFPGGVVRSGSKVGSRYAGLIASTSDAYCPTLRGRVDSKLDDRTQCVYEIVIDGMDEPCVAQTMSQAMHAAAKCGLIAISAGNYGGKLGRYHFHLRSLDTVGHAS